MHRSENALEDAEFTVIVGTRLTGLVTRFSGKRFFGQHKSWPDTAAIANLLSDRVSVHLGGQQGTESN